jgi:hypothetical protein
MVSGEVQLKMAEKIGIPQALLIGSKNTQRKKTMGKQKEKEKEQEMEGDVEIEKEKIKEKKKNLNGTIFFKIYNITCT